MNRYIEKIAKREPGDIHLKEPAKPKNIGVDLSSGKEEELYKWLTAVTLYSKPIQRHVATMAANQLASEGIVSPEAAQQAGWEKLRQILVRGHYARFDESTATRLLQQAEYLKSKYGTLTNLIDQKSPAAIRAEIESFKGIGPLGSELFIEGLKPNMAAYRKAFVKQAKETIQEHQKRVVDKLDENDGVIANHSLGSGKTLTALLAIQKMQQKHPEREHYFIAPASLTSNADKEIKKHKLKIDRKKLHITTYDKAVNDADSISEKDLGLVVLDEAHKIRNTGTKRHQGVSKILEKAHKRLLLTATPSYNKPSDIAPLVNAAAGKDVLPEDPKAFEDRYIGRTKEDPGFFRRVLLGVKPGERTVIKNKKELKGILNKYVDNYDAAEKNPEAFATKEEKVIKVPMSDEQTKYYRFAEGKVPWHIRYKIRHGLPLDKKESAHLNSFATGVRQVANTHAPYVMDKNRDDVITPKLKAAADSMEKGYRTDKHFRGVAYSNFLDAGLNQYSKELHNRGIPHTVFTGALSKTEKDKAVEDYNSGKVPVLLLSSSGGEGISLRGTKKVQIMEGHWNKSKIDQVIGRGIRFHSHDHLPKEERKVEVEHYQSTFPDGFFGKSKEKTIDEFLWHMSRDKHKINEELKELGDGN